MPAVSTPSFRKLKTANPLGAWAEGERTKRMTKTETKNFVITQYDDGQIEVARQKSRHTLDLANLAEAAELAAALAKLSAVKTTKDCDAFNRAFAAPAL